MKAKTVSATFYKH